MPIRTDPATFAATILVVMAVAIALGADARNFKDPTGREFGKEQYDAGQKPEGQMTEISYMFPKPGPDPKPVPKVAFITRAGDLGCGVGYYK
jgi:hypothetical protein